MKCWYNTTIDFSNAIRSDWQFPIVGYVNKAWSLPGNKIFNQEWLNKMKASMIDIDNILIFYRPINYTTEDAHIDTTDKLDGSPDMFGFNWIIGGHNSKMIWYSLPEHGLERKYTSTGVPYISLSINKLTEIERTTLENNVITMVRTDIPHSIQIGDEPRWCLSFRTRSKFKTWDSAVNYMKAFNLIKDR